MRTASILTTCVCGVAIALACADIAQAQRATAPSVDSPEAYTNAALEERLSSLPKELAAKVREHLSRAPETVRLRGEEHPPLPPPPAHQSERQKSLGVSGVVTASARCAGGYVVRGSHSASAPDVVIESEELIDCDVVGCRAFEIVAKRVSTAPYDLDVSVTCA